MRIVKGKGKKTTTTTSGNCWGSPGSKYMGNNAFPNGKPACKPTTPGRIPKSLSGPVHPGFEESAAKYNKKKAAKSFGQTTKPAFSLGKVDHSNDLYTPLKKSVRKGRKK